MHAHHAAILIVLLLFPNTTFSDWRGSPLPNLRRLLASSAMGIMADRTAEKDTITASGGIRTLAAAARMTAAADTSGLDYPVDTDNLANALRSVGFKIAPQDAQSAAYFPVNTEGGNGEFDVRTVDDPAALDALIPQEQSAVAKSGGALIVAAPNPSAKAYAAYNQLTPVAIWRPNGASGFLTSPSTHRIGLIANTDLTATIAEIAGAVLPGPSYGAACKTVAAPAETVARRLRQIVQTTQRQARRQKDVPLTVVVLAISIFLMGILPHKVRSDSFGAALGLAAIPIGMALLVSIPGVASFAIGMSLAGNIWGRRARIPLSMLIALFSAGSLAVILYDAVANGSAWTSGSLLGYSPIEGARYYGLGNEAMGLLIGATVVVSGVLTHWRSGALFGGALWLIVAAVLGAPTIGAKAGGLLVGLVGTAAYLIAARMRVKKLPPGIVALVAGGTIAAGLAALLLLGHLGESHVTRTVSEAKAHGGVVIWSVIHRKIAMDLHLVLHSAWIFVLLAAAYTGFWLTRHADAQRDDSYACIHRTGIAAAVACFALNDAGVVAAALSLALPWAYLISVNALPPATSQRKIVIPQSVSDVP